MNGSVRIFACKTHCNGCMMLSFVLPCASRDAGLEPDVARCIVVAA